MTLPPGYVPLTVADGIRASMQRGPGRLALREGERTLTYAQLVERIDRVANAVAAGLSLRPGEHAALMAPNCLEFVEVVCGSAAAGVAAATVSPRSTLAEVEEICNDSEARLLIVHPGLEELARSAALTTVEEIIVLGDQYEHWLAQASTRPPSIRVDEWDILCIPYTSGTTGRPKGVMLPHRSRAWTFFAMAVEFDCFGPDRRALTVTPLSYGAGFSFAVAPLFFGGSTTLLPRFEPDLALATVEQHAITSTFMVPTQFSALFALGERELARYDSSSLRTIVSMAAPLSQTAKERIVARFGEGLLFEAYGSTEGGWISAIRPADQLRKQQSVGHPLPCTNVRLVGEDGDPVPPGDIGELHVHSPFMFAGYWNRPAETADAFRDGWYVTGDLARQDDEGFLYLVDRRNDLIISGGVNVFPREVEEVLLRHEAVAEAAVFGIPDTHWGEAVHATVALHAGMHASEQELLDFCSVKLAGSKRPKTVDLTERLPRNAAGKISRRELREPYWAGFERRVH